MLDNSLSELNELQKIQQDGKLSLAKLWEYILHNKRLPGKFKRVC